MDDTTSLADAKAHLSALVTRVEQGAEVTITRHGKPVAKLVPVQPKKVLRKGGELAGDPAWENITFEDIQKIFAPLNTDEELRAEGWDI